MAQSITNIERIIQNAINDVKVNKPNARSFSANESKN